MKGKIHGVVRPDLPPNSPLLSALFPSGARGGKKSPHVKRRQVSSRPPGLSSTTQSADGTVETIVQQAGCWQVRTLAAQLRSKRDIRSRMISSAQELDSAGCGGSLLLVSGGKIPHLFLRDAITESGSEGRTTFCMIQSVVSLFGHFFRFLWTPIVWAHIAVNVCLNARNVGRK